MRTKAKVWGCSYILLGQSRLVTYGSSHHDRHNNLEWDNVITVTFLHTHFPPSEGPVPPYALIKFDQLAM